jgi:hypothetical protein
MAIFNRASSSALVLGALVLAGCSEGGDSIFTTGSLGQAEAKVDPACAALASRIEALRKEGIPDKIEKAAARKYRLTRSDLAKADQLTKANTELQARCSSVPPKQAAAEAPVPAGKATKAPPARKTAAAAKETKAPQ